jgi:hypothetical protein
MTTPCAPAVRRDSHRGYCVVIALFALTAAPAFAALPTGVGTIQRRAIPHRATVLDAARHIDVNRMNMFTTNVGSFAWDITTGNAGLVWPKGTNQTAVFASGLWLGARVGGEVRVTVAEYSREYGPGGMVGGTFDDPNRPEHVVYKVVRWTGDPADTGHVVRSPAELAADPLLDPLLHHSWSEYVAGARPYGAPTRFHRLPDTSTPQSDDSVDVEGPDVLGDMMLWEVHNDADPSLHTNDAGNSTPLGVEIQQTTFAYDRTDDLGDIVFFRFRIHNRGANTLDDLHVSLWSDPDVGGHTDDLVGCDVSLGMGFAYNATISDAIYGTAPPAVGYVLLRGPVTPGTDNALGMTAFSKYINGTDPSAAIESYHSMQGLLPDGSVVIDPTTAQSTTYFVPGDPVTGQGWVDSNPADRRLALSSGPSRMLPGESQEVWAALVVGRGVDHLWSVNAARCLAVLAKDVYLTGFTSLPDDASACSSPVPPEAANCPRPATFWGLECAAGGLGQLSGQQLEQVAAFVNVQSALFDWTIGPLANFCATVTPPHPPDARQRARSEFATFLANYSGSQLDLSIGGGQRIVLDPNTAISCPPLAATTIGQLAATGQSVPALYDATYRNLNPVHETALEGINFGLPFFGGGASEGNDFFGSTINTITDPDSFKTVEIRFSPTSTQKAHRYLRLEKADGSSPINVGRRYGYSGFYDCDFQVWDVTNNVQLDVAFVERGLVVDDDGTLSPDTSTSIPSMNRTWAPTADPIGDREYLLVFNRPYGAAPKDELRADDALLFGALPVLYVLAARLRGMTDVIDDGDLFEFRWGLPDGPGADPLLISLEGRPLSDPAVLAAYEDLADCLSQINAGIGIGPTCDDGPTPTLVSLVSAELGPDRVTLRWYCADAGLSAAVERRVAAGDWSEIGRVAPDGAGVLVFEDFGVIAGESYDYRLVVRSGDQVEYLGQASVVMPSGAVLAFRGASFEPGGGRVRLAFSLGSREPARLELLDVAGRRVLARDLMGLVPGDHAIVLEESVRLPSGIYLVRLAQGGRRVAGKAAIVR